MCINADEFERPVIVMFHTLQGYDSLFILILQELYNQHRLVENQVCVGIKRDFQVVLKNLKSLIRIL